ncbi:MAG: sodium:solute symporter family protein [Oscillospiraceae bacterium]|jgi:SSS family solute:Na+ symporter/sodium/proline symporter|nr:sodium:solute symporter family protein [Oscillospiraceae bacterium]
MPTESALESAAQPQSPAFWLTIGIYVLVLICIAVFTGRSTKSIKDLTVGGRNAGAWLSALSYGTAYFSAVMFIGYAGSTGYGFGLWGVLAGIGNTIFGSLVAWLLLAKRSRQLAHDYDLHTMPEFLEKRYGSRALKLFACIITFVFFVPYSASVYKGLGSIASVLLGIDDTLFMVIIAVLAAILLFFGGYLAQARADFVQGIIMMGGIALLIVFVIRADKVGGVEGLLAYAKSAQGLPKLAGKQWGALLSLVFMTSFGTWGLPHMLQKFFGIKTESQAKRGIVISTFFALLVAGGGYFIGSLCHAFYSAADLEGFQGKYGASFKDYIVPHMLADAHIPAVLLGIVMVLLVAASVSTLCSVTLTASSTLVLDFFKTVRKGNTEVNPKRWQLGVQLACVVFVIVSYVVANTDTPILDLMSYSWGIISGSFLAPYLMALYYKKTGKAGAWAGVGTGFAIAFVPLFCKILTEFGAAGKVAEIAGQGTQYATIAMLASTLVCFAVSAVVGRAKAQQAQPAAE